MHKLTFFPLGNADCCLVDLEGGKKLLFDYANTRCVDDPKDRRIDLAAHLRNDMVSAGKKSYDLVAFTHLDADHISGSSEFFFLDHAKKYQGDHRFKIDTLWVPAAVIIEDGCDDEARIIQAEARHRLRVGAGIRVFSGPGKLEEWLISQGLTLAERAHLITDAGQVVPGFSKAEQGVEFFVHSPFASRLEDGTLVDRNTDCLVLQATFAIAGVDTKLFLGADVDHEAITEIVNVTRFHSRDDRLEWDICKLPHHCSYKSIGPEKGETSTPPVPATKWLFEDQAQDRAIVVSTSKPIPMDDEDPQPPHRQAARYHRDNAIDRNGQFKVTMEHPSTTKPEPLVITIDRFKASLQMQTATAAAGIMTTRTPRAGSW